jgi:hypothetical protein
MADQVSVKIANDEVVRMNESLDSFKKIIDKYRVTLSAQDRRTVSKMSDASIPFVQKVLEYGSTNKEFCPPFLDLDEMATDFKAFETLNSFFNKLEYLRAAIDDTMLLSGSEAYRAARSYYDSVQQATKMKAPGAKQIYDDLKVRFENNGKRAAAKKAAAK